MSVFITVGTTDFDNLIEICDTNSFFEQLISMKVKKLKLQIGRGKYEPKVINKLCGDMGVEFSSFRFKASLDEEMDEADLIISHCGAGSILEAVSRRKPLIVVINESLQDNHQREIANAIVSEGYGLAATPCTLINTLLEQSMETIGRIKKTSSFPIQNSNIFPTIIESLFDFT